MAALKKVTKQVAQAKKQLSNARKKLGKAGKSAIAGVAGAALLAGNIGKSVKERAVDIKDHAFSKHKKTGEVITMKKSTLVALLVALAAVAGVLGALYFYVLRREKELDEYEQLLFSEDYDDDQPEEEAAEKA